MRKFTLLVCAIIFLFGSTSNLSAQEGSGSGQGRMQMGGGGSGMPAGTGTIKGSIIDNTDNVPVEYANVIIYSARDSSLVTGGITDAKGNYSIDKIPFGRYYVIFKFIGYKDFRINNVMVNPRKPEQTLEQVKLQPLTQNLEGVVVTGQKSMLQHNLDKMVINVDRSINAEGGTALDIMRNIPSVEVDVEGNVSVRGSSNLTILVDGRPSQIVSLDELPANIVQSVELITNPSVRYDPDGLSGILNIVLVKKKTPGYHGMVSLNAGTGNKYSGTINLNMRQGKFNYFANFDYRYFSSIGSGIMNRTTDFNGTTTLLDQISDNSRGGLSNNLRGGIDYFLNDKNTLSFTASASIRNFKGDDSQSTQNFLDPNPIPYLDYSRNSEDDSKMLGSQFALNYKRTYEKEGQELTVDAYYSSNTRNSDEILEQINPTTSSFENSITEGGNYSFTFQSDFVRPIGNGGRLETGIKGIFRKQDSDYIFKERGLITDPWTLNSFRSNMFVLTDQVYAGYAIYSNTIGAISYQAGFRVEDQVKKADQQTSDSVVNVSFLNFFPSAHVKWSINKVNAIQVSYSRRVNRPSPRDLNPFINYEDPLNLSYGNPWLEPEFTDAYEIGHSLSFPKTNLNSTLFYRYRTNLISRNTTLLDSVTTVTYPLNLNGGSTLGAEFILSQKITSWWRVNGSFSYFLAKIDDNSIAQSASESKSWTAKLTSAITIGKNLELQLNGNYRSPVITGIGGGGGHGPGGGGGGSQGKTKEIYSLDLGLRYMVMNKKGTITLRISDVFNTRRFITDSWGLNYTSYQERIHESQIVFVGFSYRINDYKQRQTKMDDMSNGDMEE
ncbi:MAG: TonB-dependent receptor [Tenuifilaceae bacterium]